MKIHKSITRREFLKWTSIGASAAVLAACSPKTTEAPVVPTTAPTVGAVPAATATTAPTVAATTTAAPVATVEPTVTPTVAVSNYVEAPELAPIAATKPAGVGWVAKIPKFPTQYDPVLELTSNYDLNSAIQWINGESAEKNVWSEWLKAHQGLYLKPKWAVVGGDATTQAWSTSMAANDLPEMMYPYYLGDIVAQLMRGDVFEDIQDIWEKTASPLLKQKLTYPDGQIWKPFKEFGGVKMVAVPPAETGSNDSQLWMRRDWLKKLNLQAPKTLEELETVGKALMKEGLAKFGLALTSSFGPGWMASSDVIFGAYGVMPHIWRKGSDGALFYGSTDPGMKEPLALIARWLKENFVDSEFLTKDENKVVPDIGASKFGMLFAPYWASGWPLPDTKAVNPEADWYFYENPAGPSGKVTRFGMTLAGLGVGGIGFKKGTDPKKIVAAIELWNWWYERAAHWRENQDYIYYIGPIYEGYDYVWVGDELKPGPTSIAGPWAYCTRQIPQQWPSVLEDFYKQVAEIEKAGPKNAYEKYLFQDPVQSVQRGAYLDIIRTLDTAIYDEFIGTLSADLAEVNTALLKLESQMYVDIISGSQPMSAFDTFVKDWKDQGGDKVTAAVNEWYAKSK